MEKMHSSDVVEKTRNSVEAMLLEIASKEDPATYIYYSDTGTGKTTGFIQALPKLIEAYPEIRIAIALPTNNDVEQVYMQTLKYLREDEVGLWTGDHEPSNKEAAFPTRMDRHEAGERIVFIGTHNNILGNADPRRWIGPRDLILIDEVPNTSKITSLKPTDFALAREISAERGLKTAKVYAEASNRVAKRQDNADRSQNTKWSKVSFPSPTGLRDDLAKYSDKGLVETLLPVIEFLEASRDDRTFERQQRTGKGYRVTNTYFKDVSRHFGKKVIFSATAHLEGYQINREHSKSLQLYVGPKVKYTNLKVKTSPWPAGINKYINEIVSDPDQIDTAIEHIKSIINQTEISTDPDEPNEVLLVMPVKLIKHFKKAVPDGTFKPKTVHVTNWGRDIGSNEYRKCRDVILWSNHHKPMDTTAAEYHIFADEIVSNKSLKLFKGGRTLGAAQILKEGQLYSQYKQMANRGSARFVKDDGTCGDMTLWISWASFEPFWLKDILPGCSFSPIPVVEKRFLGKNTTVIDKVVSTLSGVDPAVTEVSLPDYAELTGLNPRTVKNQASMLNKDDLSRITLNIYGWKYVAGTLGRSGVPARFVRTDTHEDDLGDGTLWNPTASSDYASFKTS